LSATLVTSRFATLAWSGVHASPALSENVWQYLRQNFLSNLVFASYDAIVDACYDWNALMALPDRIQSITQRDWAKTVST
jgi:hypothetical protein